MLGFILGMLGLWSLFPTNKFGKILAMNVVHGTPAQCAVGGTQENLDDNIFFLTCGGIY